jgi:hypothetical protein
MLENLFCGNSKLYFVFSLFSDAFSNLLYRVSHKSGTVIHSVVCLTASSKASSPQSAI